MKSNLKIIFLILGLGWQAAAVGALVSTHLEQIENFKNSVNFSERLKSNDKNEKVCVDWEKLGAPALLAGWKEISRAKDVIDGVEYYSWGFNKADKYIAIFIRISPPDHNSSPDEFLNIFAASSMRELPYTVGPVTLGTLSAVSTIKPLSNVFWFYRNALLRIDSQDTGVDPLPLAFWLQKQAETHVCPIHK